MGDNETDIFGKQMDPFYSLSLVVERESEVEGGRRRFQVPLFLSIAADNLISG